MGKPIEDGAWAEYTKEETKVEAAPEVVTEDN